MHIYVPHLILNRFKTLISGWILLRGVFLVFLEISSLNIWKTRTVRRTLKIILKKPFKLSCDVYFNTKFLKVQFLIGKKHQMKI